MWNLEKTTRYKETINERDMGMHKTMNYFLQWLHANEILKSQRGEKENKDAI